LSAKARERLQADFPELAEMLFDNDSSANDDQGGYEPPAQTFHPSNLPDVEEVKQTFERKLLNRDHPDWQTVVASEKFAAWKASELKPEEAAELDESWDADFVSSKIRDYKAWLAKQTQKAEADRLKQERLDNATTPRGIPRGPGSSYSDDDEEAMMLQSFGKRN
jgi:hypothetical protein